MKKLLMIFIILFSFPVLADEEKEVPSISTTGKASIQVEPDEVVVSFMVEISDKSLKVAQEKNDRITASLLSLASRKIGVEEENIQTNFINVNPVYEYESCSFSSSRSCKTSKFAYFETKKGVSILLKDIKKLQELLEKAIQIGVTRINGIVFKTSKEEQIKSEVRKLAAANARRQAQEVASTLDMKVGNPININVQYSSPIVSHREMGMVSAMSKSAVAAKTIAPGQIEIKTTVGVVFELED